MRKSVSALLVVAAATVIGCSSAGGGGYWPAPMDDAGDEEADGGGGGADSGGGPVDLGRRSDLAVPLGRDLAGPRPDLAQPVEEPDLAMIEPDDLALPPGPADLARPKADLAKAPADLAKSPDLAMNGNLGPPGAPCTVDKQCQGGVNARCVTDAQGWPNGYCSIFNCQVGTCPPGSECYKTQQGQTLCLKTCAAKKDCRAEYACPNHGACVPGCAGNGDCDPGEICNQELLCVPGPQCGQNTPCPQGQKCVNAQCVPDTMGGPGPGPGPACNNLPTRDCVGDNTYCGQLIQFNPTMGPGYDDYAINGETLNNQYRSWSRRDMTMLVKYATAYVDCKAKAWAGGNNMPLGLGDMSEKNGAIPGTSIGQPGHPQGTHTNGYDMDIAYYQVKPPNNYLRPVCPYLQNGQDQYHCVGEADNLDLWRTTLFLGALLTSGRVRVIGLDGKIGPLVEKAMPTLCANGWLPQVSCQKMSKLAYEVTDTGRGWFLFHYHHLHVSLNNGLGMSKPQGDTGCLGPVCQEHAPHVPFVPGEAIIVNPPSLPTVDLKL